jgi:hypothetical protein
VKLSLKDVLPNPINTTIGNFADISVDASWSLQAKYMSSGVCSETGMAKAGGKLGACAKFLGQTRCAAIGFKGSGSGTLCKTPQCPQGACQFICTDPSGMNLSGDLNAGIAVGMQIKASAFGGEASLKGMLGQGASANCTFKNGAASCGCGNAGTYLKLLTGPNAGISLTGALSYKLFNQTIFQLSTDVKGCVGGQLGSLLQCDGSLSPIWDAGGYFGWNVGNVYLPPGSPVRVIPMGSQFQLCVGYGWFERCWTFDYTIYSVGDSKWCPASL